MSHTDHRRRGPARAPVLAASIVLSIVLVFLYCLLTQSSSSLHVYSEHGSSTGIEPLTDEGRREKDHKSASTSTNSYLPSLADWRLPGSGLTEHATNIDCEKLLNRYLERAPRSWLNDTTEPLIFALHDDLTPIPESSVYKSAFEMCLITIIPRDINGKGEAVIDRSEIPDPKYGPSGILITIDSQNIRIIPPPPTYLDLPHSKIEIYTSHVSFLHAGTYTINATIEWIHNAWYQVSGSRTDIMLNQPITRIEPHQLIIEGKAQDRTRLSQCTGSVSDGASATSHGIGRWYRAAAFPDQAEYARYADEWGWTWVPDGCALRSFTTHEAATCLADKNFWTIGTSNWRRMWKIMASSDNWCRDPKDSCNCEDWTDGFASYTGEDSQKFFDGTVETRPLYFGVNSTLKFDFIGMIADQRPDPKYSWRHRVGNFEIDTTAPQAEGPDVLHGYTNAGMKWTMEKKDYAQSPDFIFLSSGTWDVAFEVSYEDYVRSITLFHEALIEMYPTTPIVLLLIPQICCVYDQLGGRRYTRPKIEMFNDATRRIFNSTNVKILDVTGLSGRADVLFPSDLGGNYICATNHARATQMRTEIQMLYNMIC